MKKIYFFCLLICIALLASCTATKQAATKEDVSKQTVDVSNNTVTSGFGSASYVELNRVKDNVWVHTTYQNYYGNNRTPSNGLVVETSEGLVLIDTPWNDEQTKELIKLAKSEFKKEFKLAIITHAHIDRIGGINALLENKIEVRSTAMTSELAGRYGFVKPAPSLESGSEIKVGDVDMEVFYPGEGHTADNIVVWFPKSKVLFGGCIVKDINSDGLGSTKDANIEQWPDSLNNIYEKYSDAQIIIPGHGKWGGIDLIEHTLQLLRQK